MNESVQTLSDAGLLSLVTGFLLPPVIAVIQQPRWGVAFRAAVTAVICVGIGYLEARLTGALSARDLLRSILEILIAANATYRSFWKPLTVTRTIEEATAFPSRSLSSVPKTTEPSESSQTTETTDQTT